MVLFDFFLCGLMTCILLMWCSKWLYIAVGCVLMWVDIDGCLVVAVRCVVDLNLWVLPLMVVLHRTHITCLYSTCKCSQCTG